MYIPDGANYPYIGNKNMYKFYAWGWLDSDYPYTKGWTNLAEKKEILDRLGKMKITNRCMGVHGDMGFGLSHTTYYANGEFNFVDMGIIYTAPAAVIFYIDKIDYLPPRIVIDKLLKLDVDSCEKEFREFKILNYSWDLTEDKLIHCKCGTSYEGQCDNFGFENNELLYVARKNCPNCGSNRNISYSSFITKPKEEVK